MLRFLAICCYVLPFLCSPVLSVGGSQRPLREAASIDSWQRVKVLRNTETLASALASSAATKGAKLEVGLIFRNVTS